MAGSLKRGAVARTPLGCFFLSVLSLGVWIQHGLSCTNSCLSVCRLKDGQEPPKRCGQPHPPRVFHFVGF
jgi:hypothetical protein